MKRFYDDNFNNNIKINNVKKNKKYKLKKTTKRLITIGLSAIIVFNVGKMFFKDSSNDKYSSTTSISTNNTTSNTTSNNSQYVFTIQNGDDEIVENYEKTSIKFSESIINEFDNYLEENKTVFKYENLYNIDNMYSGYSSMKSSNKASSLVVGGKLSGESLYERVKLNNDIYYNDKANNMAHAFYNKMKNKDLKELCILIANIINKEVNNNSDLDINSVCVNLENLKIFRDDASFCNAYVNDDMCLCINEGYIENVFSLYTERNCYDEIMYHECVHLIQYKNSNFKDSDGVEIGPFVNYVDSEQVNPLYLSWIIESSAEMKMSQALDTDITTYSTMIGYLKTVNLALTPSLNYKNNDFYDICYKEDFNSIFNLFEAKTYEQKKQVINILFSIELSQTTNAEFYNSYKEKYGIDLNYDNDKRLEIKKDLARQAVSELSNIFYKNLAHSISEGDFYLEDVFYLIRLWESDVLYHTDYNIEENYIVCQEFINKYNDTQEYFFNLIARSLDCNVEDIYAKYRSYSMNTTKGNNYSLKSFDSNKISFLDEMKQDSYKTGNPRICDIDKIMEENIKGISK